MSESTVQLPPNSTGTQIRVESGDATNVIPTGVAEEVVMLSDAQGFLTGDSRTAELSVESGVLDAIHQELVAIHELLQLALG